MKLCVCLVYFGGAAYVVGLFFQWCCGLGCHSPEDAVLSRQMTVVAAFLLAIEECKEAEETKYTSTFEKKSRLDSSSS